MFGNLEKVQEKSWCKVQRLVSLQEIHYEFHNPNTYCRVYSRVSTPLVFAE